MKIQGKGPGATSTERLPAIQQASRPSDPQRSSTADSQLRPDRVEISAEGRVRARSATETGSDRGVEPIPSDDPARLALIRQRVESGFYSKDAVLESVARAILAR